MDLELKIENFGPIDKATVQVGQFTVFAGPNNTGKTFVAKMLYSILSSRNASCIMRECFFMQRPNSSGFICDISIREITY